MSDGDEDLATPTPVYEVLADFLELPVRVKYAAPAPDVVHVTSAPVSGYAATHAATASLSTPVPVIEHVMPAHVVIYTAPSPVWNRSLPNKSVYTSTPLNKLCMYPHLKSRCSSSKVSGRSLRNVFLSSLLSRSRTQRLLQWSKTLRLNLVFPVRCQFQ